MAQLVQGLAMGWTFWGSIPGGGKRLFHRQNPSWPGLLQWVARFFPDTKQQERGADHPFSPSAEARAQ